jgi:hypothetical protein
MPKTLSTKVWMGPWELAAKGILVVALALICAKATYRSDPAFLNSYVFTAFIWYFMIAGVAAVFELSGRALGMGLERIFAREPAPETPAAPPPSDVSSTG